MDTAFERLHCASSLTFEHSCGQVEAAHGHWALGSAERPESPAEGHLQFDGIIHPARAAACAYGCMGRRHTHPSRELSVRAEILEKGGPALWDAFMAELRHLHLGAAPPARSVFDELQAAYLKAIQSRKKA
ncbi:hypothetical protein [Diaphorobacter nitroreducens]|uniref:hypothetical protein n=1 Tax=Diaphorobacter nitroreducens TaxID=164759 RepID=UPI003C71D049